MPITFIVHYLLPDAAGKQDALSSLGDTEVFLQRTAELRGENPDPSRLHKAGVRRLCNTSDAPQAYVLAYERTKAEMNNLKKQGFEIMNLGELTDRYVRSEADWSTLGMILTAITQQP